MPQKKSRMRPKGRRKQFSEVWCRNSCVLIVVDAMPNCREDCAKILGNAHQNFVHVSSATTQEAFMFDGLRRHAAGPETTESNVQCPCSCKYVLWVVPTPAPPRILASHKLHGASRGVPGVPFQTSIIWLKRDVPDSAKNTREPVFSRCRHSEKPSCLERQHLAWTCPVVLL